MERMENATDLSLLTAAQLLAADLPPRGDVLAPLLASGTAALVYGPPGIGKTFLALGIAWAVASGGSFLGWRRPGRAACSMSTARWPPSTLRERLALFGLGRRRRLKFLIARPRRTGSRARPRLQREAGIVRLMAAWDDPELVVLDTLSTPGRAAAARSRLLATALQRFLLHQRTPPPRRADGPPRQQGGPAARHDQRARTCSTW